MTIEDRAKEILKDFPYFKEQPCSLSGRFHKGETLMEHAERCANVMRYLCDAFKIQDKDREVLIACAYLHDLGKCAITLKGKVKKPLWKYHEETGWSRIECLHKIHPTLTAMILDKYKIERREEIKRIVSTHMGHWYSNTPQPHNLFEYLMVIADYISTRKKNIFKDYEPRNKKQ